MPHYQMTPSRAPVGLLFLIALLTGCPATTPAINLGSEATAEGLYAVTGIDADEAFARSDANWAQYSKIILRGIDIEYRPGGEASRSQIARRTGGPYEISEELQEEYRAMAEQEIEEELGESRRFTLVDEPGADVLAVTVDLADVVSNIPPEQIGRQSAYLSELGEATLTLELRDSTTDTVLARSVDRHTAENLDNQVRVNVAVTNTAEVERLFRLFGRQLRQQLDEFAALGE